MSDLIVEACEFWFVWTKTGHIPRRCHNTQASAEAEADRLTSLTPHGKKYIVCRAYRKSHVPPDASCPLPSIPAGGQGSFSGVAMSDRIPGSSWSNPLVYRGWNIGPGDMEEGVNRTIGFSHDDYDEEDPLDTRCGYAASIEAAKREIDEREDEAADECPDCGAVDCNTNH